MTRKQRHMIYEAAGLLLAAFFGLFTVPALINAHDTIALVAALGMVFVWLGWTAFFTYRINKELL